MQEVYRKYWCGYVSHLPPRRGKDLKVPMMECMRGIVLEIMQKHGTGIDSDPPHALSPVLVDQ